MAKIDLLCLRCWLASYQALGSNFAAPMLGVACRPCRARGAQARRGTYKGVSSRAMGLWNLGTSEHLGQNRSEESAVAAQAEAEATTVTATSDVLQHLEQVLQNNERPRRARRAPTIFSPEDAAAQPQLAKRPRRK